MSSNPYANVFIALLSSAIMKYNDENHNTNGYTAMYISTKKETNTGVQYCEKDTTMLSSKLFIDGAKSVPTISVAIGSIIFTSIK